MKRITCKEILVSDTGMCAMKQGGSSARKSAQAAGAPALAEVYHERRLLRLLVSLKSVPIFGGLRA